MTQTYTQNVKIDGAADEVQLTVEGHSTQTEALQSWQDSAGNVLAEVTGDGQLTIGDVSTPNSMLEIDRASTSTTKPERGLQVIGRISGAVASALKWVVQELELLGTGGVSGSQAATHSRLTHDNSGDSSGAELHAGNFEVINKTGSSGTPVGEAAGLHTSVTNQSGAYLGAASGLKVSMADGNAPHQITTAYGVKVEDIDQAQTNYALHTGKGIVHVGDVMEMSEVMSSPAPVTGGIRLYVKTNGKLYAMDANGVEHALMKTYTDRVKATEAANLIAYWPLADSSGTQMTDVSGNSLHGVYDDVTLGVTGIGDGGTAASFDGSLSNANFYNAGFDSAFNRNEGTLMAWVKVANSGVWTNGNEGNVFRIGNQDGSAYFTMAIRKSSSPNNQLRVFRNTNNDQGDFTINSVTETDWMCLVLTWSITADEQIFYIDGVQQTSVGSLPDGADKDIEGRANLGAFGDSSRVWNGSIAHAAIWSKALTPTQIADLASV